ncbi:MAG: glycoside hydrolase family 97 N-terminal domain-containing protein [Verrucomicrobiota bacterium]
MKKQNQELNLIWMLNKTVVTLALLAAVTSSALAVELKSPDGKVVVNFDLKDVGAAKGCPVYNVSFQGRPVLADSRLGLELRGGALNGDLKMAGQKTSASDTTWKPLLAERALIRDQYNQLVVELQETRSPQRKMQLTFRAYNEGVAFCYTLPAQAGLADFVITRENTRFAFTGDHTAWAVYAAQGNYNPDDPRRQPKDRKQGPVPLSMLKPGVERPLTVRVAEDLYVAVTEARLVDYARMKLRPATNALHAVEAFLDAERNVNGEVSGQAPFTSPWRVVMLARSPGKMLEQNYLVLNLNDPCALADISWIKPGKVIREATLTTVGGKACVDFAVRQGLQFIEYDAGWYGHEYDPAADARDVHLDPKRNPVPGSLNLREVIDYANSKSIGVILYVNHVAMEKQLDEILPIYEKWGVKGVKYGFVNVGSQRWTAWLHEAIRKAAEHHLMVDIHDEFRSTGYQRTYPNLMTVEGISGNEEFPTPVHNATLPFTRFLTGPADYTYCWNDARLKVTKAHQMAISTIYFSPWQFLFWYDRPTAVKDEPALDYWRHLPTTWDETRVLQGELGRRAVVARRKGAEWFVGAIAPVDGKFQIPLAFLESGKKFTARVYSDAVDGKSVKIEEKPVSGGSTLDADIPTNGGLAVRITPSTP